MKKKVRDYLKNYKESLKNEISYEIKIKSIDGTNINENTVISKSQKHQALLSIFTSGAGFFSDGYISSSIGIVNTCLYQFFGEKIIKSSFFSNISSISFLGTVIGVIIFGWVTDKYSRKFGMLTCNIILTVFTILCSTIPWFIKDYKMMLLVLTILRFFIGIGIGGEYPTSSVNASEYSSFLSVGNRNRYFIWFTHLMINLGLIFSALFGYIFLLILGKEKLILISSLTLGMGIIPLILLFYLRSNIPSLNSKEKTEKNVYSYKLIFKIYKMRLLVISILWFLYDFTAYSFGIYSSYIINKITPDKDLYVTFAYNVFFNLFYFPGSFGGAIMTDKIGSRLTSIIGLTLQFVVGLILIFGYQSIIKNVFIFTVFYGIFLTFGELGLGSTVSLMASKTSSTVVRGRYYGISAFVGKIGAFLGTWSFPIIIKESKSQNDGFLKIFILNTSFCLVSIILVAFFCPIITQNSIQLEDYEFHNFLKLEKSAKNETVKDYNDIPDN